MQDSGEKEQIRVVSEKIKTPRKRRKKSTTGKGKNLGAGEELSSKKRHVLDHVFRINRRKNNACFRTKLNEKSRLVSIASVQTEL